EPGRSAATRPAVRRLDRRPVPHDRPRPRPSSAGVLMKATEVPEIAGAFLFEPTPYIDERGFFCRTFDADVVRSVGLDPDAFVQDSLSRSVRGVGRGLHLRSGAGEAKLVRCSYGRIFDVVVDLRPDSPTYRNWTSFELTGETQPTL